MLLADLVERGARVVFTHDAEVAVALLERDATGRDRVVTDASATGSTPS